MIGYALPEIRRLLINLALLPLRAAQHIWSWSTGRRRRQHQARLSHCKRCRYVIT
jgi:hypothetical protein